MLKNLAETKKINISDVTDIVVSSVVPHINEVFEYLGRKFFRTEPVLISLDNINDEIKNRKHSFKVILVITIICIIINILECVLKRQIDIINKINFVILIIAIIIDISVLIYLRKLEKKEIQKNKENDKK